MVYRIGQEVGYNGEIYQCIQSHTSEPNWMPPAVPDLWKDLGPCGSTATSVAPQNSPVVYPNPATGDSVTLAMPIAAASNVTVEIFTVSMRLVQTITISPLVSSNVTIRLADKGGVQLADGLYYFRVKTNGQSWTKKVLVLR